MKKILSIIPLLLLVACDDSDIQEKYSYLQEDVKTVEEVEITDNNINTGEQTILGRKLKNLYNQKVLLLMPFSEALI